MSTKLVTILFVLHSSFLASGCIDMGEAIDPITNKLDKTNDKLDKIGQGTVIALAGVVQSFSESEDSHPMEVCNGLDDDGDGVTDEVCPEVDEEKFLKEYFEENTSDNVYVVCHGLCSLEVYYPSNFGKYNFEMDKLHGTVKIPVVPDTYIRLTVIELLPWQVNGTILEDQGAQIRIEGFNFLHLLETETHEELTFDHVDKTGVVGYLVSYPPTEE